MDISCLIAPRPMPPMMSRCNRRATREAQAKADVVRARQQVVTQSLASPQYKEAEALVDSTNAKYQTLKRQVQDELTKSNAQYGAAERPRRRRSGIESRQEQLGDSLSDLSGSLRQKEKTTNAIRDMENAAMDQAGGTTARTEWKAACAALDDLKKTQRRPGRKARRRSSPPGTKLHSRSRRLIRRRSNLPAVRLRMRKHRISRASRMTTTFTTRGMIRWTTGADMDTDTAV